MPKQPPMFDEPRQEMFHRLYEAAIDDLRHKLKRRSAINSPGCWEGRTTRQRVRKLARAQARLEMREYRRLTHA